MKISSVLMIVLGGIAFIALIALIVQLFKRRVWVYSKGLKKASLLKIGFFSENAEYEVPEVHLTDRAKGPAIGRFPSGEGNDPNTYIELLLTDPDDESAKPQYRTLGYIDPEGMIYKVEGKRKRAEIIGYTAKPSDPNTPTPNGERTWKSLWLKCTLNAYLGKPQPKPVPEAEPQPTKEDKETPKEEENQTKEKEEVPTSTSEGEDINPVIEENTPEAEGAKTIPEEISEDQKQEVATTKEERIELTQAFESTESPLPETEIREENVEVSSGEEPNQSSSESQEVYQDKGEIENQDSKEREKKEDSPLRLEKRKKNDKKNDGVPAITPIAVASYTGFPFGKGDKMTPVGLSAAFGLFYNKYNKNNNQEHYASTAYGWKDTALLSAFIYTCLYVIWYIFNVKVLGLRFIGYRFWQDFPLFFSYFALWAIVRAVKIEFIERSDTIQPKIDLFNKVVGQKGYDILIIICCAITLAFSGKYYRFDFLPLALVIITAISINLSLRASKKPWLMTNPFATNEEEDESEEVQNPGGDIQRLYEWELDSPEVKNVKGQLALYFDERYITELRSENPFFNQRKDKSVSVMVNEMFSYLMDHKTLTLRSRYIVQRIQEISKQYGLSPEDTLQFTLDFVQEPNIRFVLNRDSASIQKFEDYIRYPDEVLYDKEADSNSKAFLAAILVHYLKYNVVFLYSRLQHHGAIGIEVDKSWLKDKRIFGQNIEDITFTYNHRQYVFCETTADGFRIGGTMGGMSPDDFDEKVEIPVIVADADDSNVETITRIYKWKLDSEKGTELEGTYTLEFDEDLIEELRDENPFKQYGLDGKSYEDNVKKMFAYLDEDSSRKNYIREIASYIKKSAREAKLDDLDTVQFALDFCQEPNIEYKVDEECDEIPYNDHTKEYMRYPDEVLFDKRGDCDCKSSLTIALFRELGYKTLFMMSEKLKHAAVAVEYNPAWKEVIKNFNEGTTVREYNGTQYIYCETTGDHLRVGNIKEGDSIQDFETLLEF